MTTAQIWTVLGIVGASPVLLATTLVLVVNAKGNGVNIRIDGLEDTLTERIKGSQVMLSERISGSQATLTERISGSQAVILAKLEGMDRDLRQVSERGLTGGT